MCGITGIVFGKKLDDIEAMTTTLTHRGPDDQGIWVNREKGVALGFRRLSIIDLSQAGHQPMFSRSGRFVIVFNGEIYNFKEIAAELLQRGWRFKGHSDTEVLLAAIETWGIHKTLNRLNGMFGFALWDNQRDTLYLARDRFGEKPLYWGWAGDGFIFASELKALKKYQPLSLEIDRRFLNLFMRYSYVPAPHTIYKHIEKVEPGQYLEINKNKEIKKTAYWSAFKTANAVARHNIQLTDQEFLGQLENALKRSISLRSTADVPLGAFLSGGIDSSLVTALMQESSTRPIRTFTIGFNEKKFNEAPHARAVARHLGTHHTEIYVTDEDSREVIPKLPQLYDEPFADSSQIPTYLVSQLARHSVTVCLSGDGGDELFGGYNRYLWGAPLYDRVSRLPSFVRKGLASLLRNLNAYQWDRVAHRLSSSIRPGTLNDKLVKASDALSCADSLKHFYTSITSLIKNPDELVLGSGDGHQPSPLDTIHLKNMDSVSWMMIADVLTYLPGDILTKLDRASMGNSLEARAPFLDPDLFTLAWGLPPHLKIHNHVGKIALRELLYKRVPKTLIERPKTGFGVPIGNWLSGPLKEWANDLLSESRLREQGYLNVGSVQTYWNDHCSGKRDRAHELWNILMFQAWLQENKNFSSGLCS